MKGISALLALSILGGCAETDNVKFTSQDSAGEILIGIGLLPPSDQNYSFVITGFDAARNRPSGQFSGTRMWFERNDLMGSNACRGTTCYYHKRTDPGDYIIYMFATSDHSVQNVGPYGLAYIVTLSNGTYMFHVVPGKVTYAGDYLIRRTPLVDNEFQGAGTPAPTITYNSDIADAQDALKQFKGITAELVTPKPKFVTFEP